MKLFQVRIFSNNQWNVIRTYAFRSEALDFAENLWVEWDVKEVTLEEANTKVGA